MDKKVILSKVDHTLLGQAATWAEIKTILDDGIKYGCASACIPAAYVKQAAEYVDGKLPICTVIGFPLGATLAEIKLAEAERALALGADELDMVINIGALKDKKDDLVFKDINQIANLTRKKGKVLKVIIETAVLTEEEKERACKIIMKTDADFVKTSTGFSSGGASIEDIVLIRKIVGDSKKIKASGGIKTREFAKALIEAGADRLGASSAKEIIFP